MARLTGKNAALYMFISSSWVWVADLFDVTVDTDLALLDASIKGDNAARMMVSHTSGRLTARRYTEAGGGLALSKLVTTGLRYDFAVVVRDPTLFSTSAGDPATFSGNADGKIQGAGYINKATLNAPRGMATDSLEITFDVVPSIS